jgi:predicted small secreted protein
MMMKKHIYLAIILACVLVISSCENVVDGYRIDYEETPADFSVGLVTADRGPVGDSIIFSITANSEYNIKSLVVTTSVSGAAGTGFTINSTQVDPLIDHAYGTIQDNVKEIDINYCYVVENDSLDPEITFTLVDEYGSKTVKHSLYAIPPVVKYDSVVLFAKSSYYADGFSSVNGEVYHYLGNYSETSTANLAVQEALDIVFIIANEEAVLVGPYNGNFTTTMSVRNKTLFELLPDVSSEEFDNLSSASLSSITEEAEVGRGSTDIWNVQVGDIIGFRTDLASTNPYHYGMLRVNAIHPTVCDYYEGTSYLLEIDVVTQN